MRRKINGKIYQEQDFYSSKSEAKKVAKYGRSKGFLIRVIPGRAPGGKNQKRPRGYYVFARKK